jgi:cation diffusion facilitator family transporter
LESSAKGAKVVWFSISLNIILAIAKLSAGIEGNSFALIADSIESTTDIFSSFLLLLALHYAYMPADENHPYGHGKAESIATIIISGFLILSASYITYECFHNIFTPHELPKPFTLWVLGATIILKEAAFRYMRNKSESHKSSGMMADAWHHRSDAISSLAAFTGICVALWLGKGYESADDWAGLIASAVIFYNAFRLMRPALGEIMDENRYDELLERIRDLTSKVPQVQGVEKCHIRKSGSRFFVDMHIEVDPNLTVFKGHEIAHLAKDRLMAEFPEIADVLIHIEPSPN